MTTDQPGREIPKEYREIVLHQITVHGWRYDNSGKGHPVLIPADITQRKIAVPTTPGDRRSLMNFTSQVRRSGGTWPPGRK